MTRRLMANPVESKGSRKAIEQAAAVLRGGGMVAFPTETVYGLGAHALDVDAVGRIFAAKGRPSWDPLIVHIADESLLPLLAAEVPRPARLWAEHFWPGPLTLLLPRASGVPDAVAAGGPRVGIRVPRHPVAQALLRAAGVPVAAPSANRFGHVSPTSAEHVLADLDGRIDVVLDGGPCECGVESTVVDTTVDPCLVYRPGVISVEQLRALWPAVELYREGLSQAGRSLPMPSPGVGLRHYAPAAQLVLIEHGPLQASTLQGVLEAAGRGTALPRTSGTTGVLLPEGLLPAELPPRPELQVFAWGRWSEPASLARLLFTGLRQLDTWGVERIVCPMPAPGGIGDAVRDRLTKAAKKR